MRTTIDTREGKNGRTLICVTGPTFPAVQAAIFDLAEKPEFAASTFQLPRRIGDHFEAHGFAITSMPAKPELALF